MAPSPRKSTRRRPAQTVSALIRGRRVILRGPVGYLRKTRPLLTDT